MIADDDHDVTLILKDVFLYDDRFKVDSFNNPILALNFQAGSYDLLIIDINMPQMIGVDLYEKIRTRYKLLY